LGQVGEHVSQVGAGFVAIGLGRLDQRVEVGARLGALDGGAEQPRPSPLGEGADGVLRAVVVDLESAIVEEASEARPMREQVGECLTERGLGRHLGAGDHGPGVQALEQRAGLGLTHGVSLFGRAAPDPSLDGVDVAEVAQGGQQSFRLLWRFGGQLVRVDAHRLQGIDEVAARVGEAQHADDSPLGGELVVAGVGVGLQIAGEALEQALGDGAAARGVVVEQHHRPLAGARNLHPHVRGGLRALARLLEHLHGGLVAVDVGALEQALAQQVDERLHELARAHHPARLRLAGQRYADALELLGEPVQRHAIDLLGAGDEGEQAGACLALRDGLRRHRRSAKLLGTARAAVLHPAVAQHPEARRHHVELLAGLLGEGLEPRAIVRTHPLGLGQLVHDVDARQVLGQRTALAARPR